jgi:hypothetical protein
VCKITVLLIVRLHREKHFLMYRALYWCNRSCSLRDAWWMRLFSEHALLTEYTLRMFQVLCRACKHYRKSVSEHPFSAVASLLWLYSADSEWDLFSEVLHFGGAPIILGRCPSLSAHESESMLRTYLVCREKQERERQAHVKWEKHTVY